MDGPRPVRHPPKGGRESGVRRRQPPLLGGMVRPAPGPDILGRAPRPAAQSPPRPRPTGGASGVGVPGAAVDVGPVGSAVSRRSPPRRPPRAETAGALLRPPRLRAAVEAFYDRGHAAGLAQARAKDRGELRALEDEA